MTMSRDITCAVSSIRLVPLLVSAQRLLLFRLLRLYKSLRSYVITEIFLLEAEAETEDIVRIKVKFPKTEIIWFCPPR